jgi:hypothetical protein
MLSFLALMVAFARQADPDDFVSTELDHGDSR